DRGSPHSAGGRPVQCRLRSRPAIAESVFRPSGRDPSRARNAGEDRQALDELGDAEPGAGADVTSGWAAIPSANRRAGLRNRTARLLRLAAPGGGMEDPA